MILYDHLLCGLGGAFQGVSLGSQRTSCCERVVRHPSGPTRHWCLPGVGGARVTETRVRYAIIPSNSTIWYIPLEPFIFGAHSLGLFCIIGEWDYLASSMDLWFHGPFTQSEQVR